MFVKDRPSGMRRWAPSVFATFWVVLAGFAGAYLYSAINEPAASREASASMAAAAPQMSASNPDDLAKIASLQQANTQQAQDLAQANDTINTLTEQVASLNKRLQPIEKLLGPVAAMPTHQPAETAPPPPAPAADSDASDKKAEPDKKSEADDKSADENQAADSTPALTPDDTKTASVEPVAPVPPPAPVPAPAPKPEAPSASTVPHGNVPPLPPQRPSNQAAASENTSHPAVANKPKEDNVETASLNTAPAPTPAPTPSVMADPNLPPGTNRFGIELGSVEERSALKPMWRDLMTKHAALVAGLEARRVMAPDKHWRLIAGPFSSANEAAQACALFKKVQLSCAPTVFAGDQL